MNLPLLPTLLKIPIFSCSSAVCFLRLAGFLGKVVKGCNPTIFHVTGTSMVLMWDDGMSAEFFTGMCVRCVIDKLETGGASSY
jgi:hypothetical protein